MDRDIAKKILDVYGRPQFKIGNTFLTFSRQQEQNLTEIESMTDENLVEHRKSLVWMNYIYSQVSLNELQRIDLLDLEIDSRKTIDRKALDTWYDKAQANFDESDFS